MLHRVLPSSLTCIGLPPMDPNFAFEHLQESTIEESLNTNVG